MLLEVVLICIWIVLIIQAITIFKLSRKVSIENEGIALGFSVPDLKLQTIEGGIKRLIKMLQNEPLTILCMVTPECKFCRKIIPLLEEMQKEANTISVKLLFLGEESAVKEYLDSNKINIESFVVSFKVMKSKINISAFPYAMIVNQYGIVVRKGIINADDVSSWFHQKNSA